MPCCIHHEISSLKLFSLHTLFLYTPFCIASDSFATFFPFSNLFVPYSDVKLQNHPVYLFPYFMYNLPLFLVLSTFSSLYTPYFILCILFSINHTPFTMSFPQFYALMTPYFVFILCYTCSVVHTMLHSPCISHSLSDCLILYCSHKLYMFNSLHLTMHPSSIVFIISAPFCKL